MTDMKRVFLVLVDGSLDIATTSPGGSVPDGNIAELHLVDELVLRELLAHRRNVCLLKILKIVAADPEVQVALLAAR